MSVSATSDKLLLMGAILGAHGIKGEVKVKSFAAKPSDIAGYGALTDAKEKRRFEVTVVGTSDATRGIVTAADLGRITIDLALRDPAIRDQPLQYVHCLSGRERGRRRLHA